MRLSRLLNDYLGGIDLLIGQFDKVIQDKKSVIVNPQIDIDTEIGKYVQISQSYVSPSNKWVEMTTIASYYISGSLFNLLFSVVTLSYLTATLTSYQVTDMNIVMLVNYLYLGATAGLYIYLHVKIQKSSITLNFGYYLVSLFCGLAAMVMIIALIALIYLVITIIMMILAGLVLIGVLCAIVGGMDGS
jgi:hypothetical protein